MSYQKKQKFYAIALSLILTLSMVIGFTTTSFAASDAPKDGTVYVSITKDNFDKTGNYVGGGSAALLKEGKTITNVAVPISEIRDYIKNSKIKDIYLNGVKDPQNGEPSVLDAIITAVLKNTKLKKADFKGGWDSYTKPNGGYLSNIGNYALKPNKTDYYKGKNGNKWGKSTGSGWQIAYASKNGKLHKADIYGSNILVEDGMKIVFDVSDYEMDWDTGKPM